MKEEVSGKAGFNLKPVECHMTDISVIKMIISVAVWRVYPSWMFRHVPEIARPRLIWLQNSFQRTLSLEREKILVVLEFCSFKALFCFPRFWLIWRQMSSLDRESSSSDGGDVSSWYKLPFDFEVCLEAQTGAIRVMRRSRVIRKTSQRGSVHIDPDTVIRDFAGEACMSRNFTMFLLLVHSATCASHHCQCWQQKKRKPVLQLLQLGRSKFNNWLFKATFKVAVTL